MMWVQFPPRAPFGLIVITVSTPALQAGSLGSIPSRSTILASRCITLVVGSSEKVSIANQIRLIGCILVRVANRNVCDGVLTRTMTDACAKTTS